MAQTGIELYRVLPETLPVAWPVLGPMLDEACDFCMGEYDSSDLFQGIAEGRFQLWASIVSNSVKGTAVTELVTFPSKMVCNVIAMGGSKGSLNVLLALQDQIEAWALSEGATILKAYVRPGLFKHLKQKGFSQQQYVVAKDLSRKLH